MSAPPPLTVGLPVYNGETYLADALDALLGQSFSDFELIISDNASTDGTAEICRHYGRLDSRIRYMVQSSNIGAVRNHHFLVQQSRSALFKWAAADDLYARELLERCLDALKERPDAVLAHSFTAAIDSEDRVTQALAYPLATDSPNVAVRFHSMLFGPSDDNEYKNVIRADDQYGVVRADVLRRVLPQGSYYHSDRALMAALVLHGTFYQVPDWLYFRRDHRDRPQHACPTVRSWCANLDPRRRDRIRHPTFRLLAEYPLGYVEAIRRAPISPSERRECYGHVARWALQRALGGVRRALVPEGPPALVPFAPRAAISIADVVSRGTGS
ncbi:MAG TPA: glycosyltransferase family A protein, partial [Acidimicrobiales bacterium]|nr:glycosyltransferase family A protein [Acidimicrobiales bacterium]